VTTNPPMRSSETKRHSTAADVFPAGMTPSDIACELAEIRENLETKRRIGWGFSVLLVFSIWKVGGGTGAAFGAGVALTGALLFALYRLTEWKMRRLEGRAELLLNDWTESGEREGDDPGVH
jgi:hypothetical protein